MLEVSGLGILRTAPENWGGGVQTQVGFQQALRFFLQWPRAWPRNAGRPQAVGRRPQAASRAGPRAAGRGPRVTGVVV